MADAYDHTFSITLSADLTDIAARIGRAMDSDSGGNKSFSPSEDGLTISTSTSCTEKFCNDAQYLLANPQALHAVVGADYAQRWGDLAVPTLAECQAFCAGVVMPAVEPATQPTE